MFLNFFLKRCRVHCEYTRLEHLVIRISGKQKRWFSCYMGRCFVVDFYLFLFCYDRPWPGWRIILPSHRHHENICRKANNISTVSQVSQLFVVSICIGLLSPVYYWRSWSSLVLLIPRSPANLQDGSSVKGKSTSVNQGHRRIVATSRSSSKQKFYSTSGGSSRTKLSIYSWCWSIV